MSIRRNWNLEIGVDDILRSQGASPQALRNRSPKFARLAERALEEGREFLVPVALYDLREIAEVRHEQVHLEDGTRLSGPLIAQHLASASSVFLAICTIGGALEARVREIMPEDPAYALALDGLGSAATEQIANELCWSFEQEAVSSGLETTIPLSPGMIDWPVDVGQRQIFASLPAEEIGVSLTPNGLMIPMKSLTFVMGIGKSVHQGRTTCDYCSMAETCRYREHYAQERA